MCESDLSKWIERKCNIQNKIDKNDEKYMIGEIVNAFSEYIYAVDPEYQYNKSFLIGFIENFSESIKKLRKKKKWMLQLLESLDVYKNSINIDIDGAWAYEGIEEKIVLSDSFDRRLVNADKLRVQIKYLGTPEFVIAKTINFSNSKEIEEVKNLFENRLNMKNDNSDL